MKVYISNLPYPWGRLGQGLGTLGHLPFVLEMIYLNNYLYTGFMVLVVMVCITISSTIVSLKNSISLILVRLENREVYSQFWIITSCPYFIIWEVLLAITR